MAKFEQPRYAENPIRSTATGRARLTEADVRQIRHLANVEHWTIPEITRTFFPSISTETIARAARGETWRNIPDVRLEQAVAARHEPPAEGEESIEELRARLKRVSAATQTGGNQGAAFAGTALEQMNADIAAEHAAGKRASDMLKELSSEELIMKSLAVGSGEAPVPGFEKGEKRPPVSPLDE